MAAKVLITKLTMKLVSALLIVGFLAISLNDVHGDPIQPLKYKPIDDISCYFGAQPCNYTIENANPPTFQGIKPTYDNTIAWIKSNVTVGDGPYCLKIRYLSTTGTAGGALNSEIVTQTNITVLMVTPDDGKVRKLYEYIHRARAFEIRSGKCQV